MAKKKGMTLVQAYEVSGKLSEQVDQLSAEIKELGTVSLRNEQVRNTSDNKLMYNITFMNTMCDEVKTIFAHETEDVQNEQVNRMVERDIQEKIADARMYIKKTVLRDKIKAEIQVLVDYLQTFPRPMHDRWERSQLLENNNKLLKARV